MEVATDSDDGGCHGRTVTKEVATGNDDEGCEGQ